MRRIEKGRHPDRVPQHRSYPSESPISLKEKMNNETISQPQSLSQQGTSNITLNNATLDSSGAGGISGTGIK